MYIGFIQVTPNCPKNIDFEGVGAQYQKIIALLSIAKRHNLKYYHIMTNVGHNYDNEANWDEKWDNMFNIKKLTNNDEIEDISKIGKQYSFSITDDEIKYLSMNNNLNILRFYSSPFEIFDKNPEYYLSNIQEDLIKIYDENNNTRKLIYNKNKINIAIHIRVYNDNDENVPNSYIDYKKNNSIKYYMTCEKYINLINYLKEKYPNSDIHIFSQKKYFDISYKKLRDIDNIIFHFDDLNTFDTFHHLCKADILCMGSSSFSILAAFYNKNTVIYLPYCHPPSLSKWIKYEP